jgi:diacylglycerol kinase (ATP)
MLRDVICVKLSTIFTIKAARATKLSADPPARSASPWQLPSVTTNHGSTMKNTATGLNRIVRAAGFSYEGFVSAIRTEAAFRQELIIAAIAIPVGMWLADNGVERALLLGSVVLILVIELLNSAVEAVVDRVGEDYHPLSKKAKDIGSAAVFLGFGNALMIWVLVLTG